MLGVGVGCKWGQTKQSTSTLRHASKRHLKRSETALMLENTVRLNGVEPKVESNLNLYLVTGYAGVNRRVGLFLHPLSGKAKTAPQSPYRDKAHLDFLFDICARLTGNVEPVRVSLPARSIRKNVASSVRPQDN